MHASSMSQQKVTTRRRVFGKAFSRLIAEGFLFNSIFRATCGWWLGFGTAALNAYEIQFPNPTKTALLCECWWLKQREMSLHKFADPY